MRIMQTVVAPGLSLLLLAFPAPAQETAKDYPNRLIKLLQGFPARRKRRVRSAALGA